MEKVDNFIQNLEMPLLGTKKEDKPIINFHYVIIDIIDFSLLSSDTLNFSGKKSPSIGAHPF